MTPDDRDPKVGAGAGAPEETRGPWWLALRVIDEPVPVFRDLARRPRALVPIGLIVLVSAVVAFGTPESSIRGAVQAQAARFREAAPERFDEADVRRMITEASSPRARVISLAAGTAGTMIGLVAVSLVLMFIFGSTSGVEIRFKDEFAIAVHAYVPQLIGGLLVLTLMMFADFDQFEISLGFLFDRDTSPFLHAFTNGLTLFGGWNVYLLALGNQVKTNARGVGGSLAIVGGLWLAMKLVLAGIAAMAGV